MAWAGDRTLKSDQNTGASVGRTPETQRGEKTDMSDFRQAYSQLIMAVWDNPAVENQITRDPSKLQQYGFTTIPSKVTFQAATSTSGGIPGYEDQLADYEQGGAVTFYIPPKPKTGAAEDTSYCCCCCPCCTCT